MSAKRSGKKLKARVSFAEEDTEEKPRTQKDAMLAELDRLRRRDEEQRRSQEEYRKEEIRKVRAQMDKEQHELGLQLIPGSRLSKQEIMKKLGLEEKCLLKEERTQIAAETSQMVNNTAMRYGLHHKKKAPNLVTLAADFVAAQKSSNVLGLPDRVVKEMTLDEIIDLKKLFDLYDVAGAGYIRRKDVHKLSSILGFRFSKQYFNESLDTLVKDPAGKVTFVTFLDFIIKEQQGNDPFEEVQQCFRILDADDKGYVTFEDIRRAADSTKCGLSERQIHEMLDEADTSGDGKISLDEFTIIMLRTSAFNF
ncbi:centrin-2-like [Dreissena polymorpha]|uniref:EF-hand domain-containing protein n=1 Tax=Dreissena polymorpha TaxID=45954 RepID=A0A9D4N8H0_DREPO|nr:centrin-2-like [Dreissena polymorpha]XP_052263832.1 centrin-2-like [Dreissena polymorpha]KAH3889129.1 hypothetical protein DPMN_013179 [Dreissena polymorpha]